MEIIRNSKRTDEVDFLFVYEVKARELENICLLSYELERRGYSVGIINTWQNMGKYERRNIKKINAKVVIAFAGYTDGTLAFVLSYVGKYKSVINLHWEQMRYNKDFTLDVELLGVKGKAKEIIHICWGEISYNFLADRYQVNDDNLRITGHIGMDFFLPCLTGYYQSKEEMCKRYDFDLNMKICLYISSFSYINLPEELIPIGDMEFAKVSIESQRLTLEWISDFLKTNKDFVFIYRPHPAEGENKELLKMQEEYRNFYVFCDDTVKQWILIADKILIWFSTTMTEVYFAHKQCAILRPIEIPFEYELSLYENSKKIETYSEFKNFLVEDGYDFPIKGDVIKQNICNNDKPVYLEIANLLEEMLSDKKYRANDEFIRTIDILINPPQKNYMIKFYIRKLKNFFVRHFGTEKEKYATYIEMKKYRKEMANRNGTTPMEVDRIINRISESINAKK